MDPGNERIHQRPNPRRDANICSTLFFCWLNPLVWLGWKRKIQIEDIPKVLDGDSSKLLGDKLQSAWNIEKKKRNAKFIHAYFAVFGKEFFWSGILYCFVECFVRIMQRVLMSWLITSFQEDKTSVETWSIGFAFIAITICGALLIYANDFNCVHIGMRMGAATSSVIYRKALRIPKASDANNNVGRMINMLSNDIVRLNLACHYMHMLWIAPLQLIIILVITWHAMGPSTLAGALVLVLFACIQSCFGKMFSYFRCKIAKKTDFRIGLMSEIINGIKVIKMYTWERPFAALIAIARKEEIKIIRKSTYLKTFNLGFFFVAHKLVMLAILVVFSVIEEEEMKAANIFLTLALYFRICVTITLLFPRCVLQISECQSSVLRIQKFLESDEIEASVEDAIIQKYVIGLKVKGVSTCWKTEENIRTKDALNDISFKVQNNQLCAIIGAVGSGKSTLLHTLLGELPVSGGMIEHNGARIGYSAQEPWIFSSTVLQNIIFNQTYDKDHYQRVLQATALDEDINSWDAGNETLVGDRGIILSGGQKARINLARCIYRDADIFLLDDPLSAVDARVGQHIYECCIRGFLKDKCVILVTHQVHYLKDADEILVMRNGEICARGTFQQLSDMEEINTINYKAEADELPERVNSINGHTRRENTSTEVKPQKNNDAERRKKNEKLKTYKAFFTSGGSKYTLSLLLISHIITLILSVSSDIYLGDWVNQEEEGKTGSNAPVTNFNLLVYAGQNVGIIIFSGFRTGLQFLICLKSAETLHNAMFTKILNTHSRFFDVNPVGKILNRFSKDIGAVDELLPQSMYEVSTFLGLVFGSVLTAIYYKPILIPPTLIIFVVFYYIHIYYLATSKPMKILESSTKAPIVSQLSATVDGLITVRTTNAGQKLINEFDEKQDLHSSAYYAFQSAARWNALCFDYVGSIFVILCVFSFLIFDDSSLGGDFGVVLSSSLFLVGGLQYALRQTGEMEAWMTSVKRILEYGQLEDEETRLGITSQPSKSWPRSGKIEMRNVSLSYDEEKLVLKNVTFDAKSGEKIGIVGRTGAGKSSLVTALLRLVKPKGDILIDNIDVSTIQLERLRKNISIIPQDPLLFAGTLRKNLDPFNDCNDDEIWLALKQVQLHKTVFAHSNSQDNFPLDMVKVSDGGSNFSAGQRQLICLARAILKNNRILVMDEATANVDPKTDKVIQETIKERFAHCTILTIAHRLPTILDSDRILVLSNGEVEDFDSPENLIRNTNGTFYRLIESMGNDVSGEKQ